VSEEEAGSWKLLENKAFNRQITMKDNVRDAYFAAVGALKSDLLTTEEFLNRKDYGLALQEEMNDVSQGTVEQVQDYLQTIKDNLYSFETDSGKADMITGKVVANYQWSGDAVYAMDQAEEDEYYLNFAIPREATNIYFDGWIMLKNGIGGDAEKQHAAEAFINFISRPDSVIRNMYYIGYTSAISGGEDDRIFEYLDWNYGAEEDEEETVDYPVGYFFSGEKDDEDYVLTVPEEQLQRQLSAQYPSEEVIRRASIMVYFNEEQSERINRMWIRVRCFNIENVPLWVWIALALVIAGSVCIWLQRKAAKEKLYS
jgi:spermidine/putrescine transport system substrate-binding protein